MRIFAIVLAMVLAVSISAHTQMAPQIYSVRMLGAGAMYPNDQLRVVLIGTPGGVATFDLPGAAIAVPMMETSPGCYAGKLYMPNVPPIESPRVVGHLSWNGILVEREADNSLAEAPAPLLVGVEHPFVTVISPQPHAHVVRDFVVRGYTTPGATVQVEVTKAHKELGTIITNRHRRYFASAIADTAGKFAIPMHLTGEVDWHETLELQVTATDPSSGVSSKNVKMRIGVGE